MDIIALLHNLVEYFVTGLLQVNLVEVNQGGLLVSNTLIALEHSFEGLVQVSEWKLFRTLRLIDWHVGVNEEAVRQMVK